MFLSRFIPRTAALARVSVARNANIQRTWIPRAFYAAGGGGLTRKDITTRILDTLQGYEKIDPAKLTLSSSFIELGLDSLDAVEVVMSIEEEFSIEIPDAEADEIQTVAQAIDYIAKTPEAH